MSGESRWHAIWYRKHPLSLLLAPLGWLYALVMVLRRAAYRWGVLPRTRVGVPVLVVGNVSAGGTGKTPLVVWLAGYLISRGWRPGILCRGYGGTARHWPQQVRGDSDAGAVGDEAVLLARRTGCPVVSSGPKRVAAARELVRHGGCDVIISDDGLQHLALERDVEVVVVDGVRRHGNGRCLPAGPLREPLSRLASVDLVVSNGLPRRGEFGMQLVPGPLVRLADGVRRPLSDFAGVAVHAVCGIGHPRRFFALLEGHGLTVDTHAFADHHRFVASDLDFGDDAPVIMTEKDAVKCGALIVRESTASAGAAVPGDAAAMPVRPLWYLPVTVELPDAFCTRLERLLVRPADASGPPS